MENKINNKLNIDFKKKMDNIKEHLDLLSLEDNNKLDIKKFIDLLQPIILTKEDFQKRKRVKTNVPSYLKCKARRANGEQCSRKRKNNICYCGTHEKNRPHGEIEDNVNIEYKKVEVWVEEINGIIYYIDNHNNVYRTQDILANKTDPQVICKYFLDKDNKICLE